MLESSSYDQENIAISSFGSDLNPAMGDAYIIADFKGPLQLTFDCFFDGGQNIKRFFDDQYGAVGNNEVYAVMPSGELHKFDHSDFAVWLDTMYQQAYDK